MARAVVDGCDEVLLLGTTKAWARLAAWSKERAARNFMEETMLGKRRDRWGTIWYVIVGNTLLMEWMPMLVMLWHAVMATQLRTKRLSVEKICPVSFGKLALTQL